MLCGSGGEALGALPHLEVDSPWWPDVEPVVTAARDRHGIDLRVLRLLDASGTSDVMGGDVTYLAEVAGRLPPDAPLGRLDDVDAGHDDPLRAPYARPGGLAATIAWANDVLRRAGRPPTGPPVQVKTWNLSSVLRVPAADGPVWCKSVPPFLAHEGALIELLAADEPALVPLVLGRDPATGTILLAHVPGDDQWDAPVERLVTMVDALVRLQARWAPRPRVLLDAGLPDWRAAALAERLTTLVRRSDVRDALSRVERAAADALVDALPERFADLEACGVPETLVHGDFHPGNWRSDGSSLVLLDWGDSGIGHPLLDAAAFLPRVPDDVRPAVRSAWIEAWQRAQPGCDPARALDLVLPIAALRQALVYRTFLDGIERAEQRYHEGDVPAWIRRALAPPGEAGLGGTTS